MSADQPSCCCRAQGSREASRETQKGTVLTRVVDIVGSNLPFVIDPVGDRRGSRGRIAQRVI
jgi:hypothetical protein